jgi:uncharacterized phiE125 gp8 family phage protein
MRYRLQTKTGPTSEPVALADVKLHLHETDTVQESVISGMIQTAREQAEAFTSRAFLAQTFAMYLDGFPNNCNLDYRVGNRIYPNICVMFSEGQEITLPRAPVTSVDSIKYLDTTGTLQTLDPSLYLVDPQTDDDPVRILPAYGKTWPATRPQPNAVIIQFEAGYADAAHVPATIKLAMSQAVGDWYNNRDAVVVDSRVAVQELPNAAKALLWDYRLF